MEEVILMDNNSNTQAQEKGWKTFEIEPGHCFTYYNDDAVPEQWRHLMPKDEPNKNAQPKMKRDSML